MDKNINDNERMYITLMRGFDRCVHTMEWQNFSTVKYTLPDYFQDDKNAIRDAGGVDRWYNEVATHIGETFNYQWMPVGKPMTWTDEELEEMRGV